MAVPTTRHKVQKINHFFRDILLLSLLGFAMTFIFGYNNSIRQFLIVGSFTALLWILLWKGNSQLSGYLETKIDWLLQPFKSLAVLSIGTFVYTISVVFLLMQVYAWIFDINFGDSLVTIYSATIITIVISLFMHGRGFLVNWKMAELETEKAKQESIKAKYESLKNQVNPHFLFNSLNALTSLVYEDQDKAATFIKQLSEVYRYVLDSRDKEVVSLAEELKFLDSYSYLQQIRFGNKLKLSNKLNSLKGNLPPLALQMLVENAIKHNIISDEQPLTISLFQLDNQIVIENSLQPKKVLTEASGGLGLENIRKRYEFLSNQPISISKENNTFRVMLPILFEEE